MMPQSYFVIDPVSSRARLTSVLVDPKLAAGVAVNVSTVPTLWLSSGGWKLASGAVPAAVDSRARAACPGLPSGTATRGRPRRRR